MDLLIAATAEAERDHFWFRGFRAFIAPLLARAVAGRSAPRILDCGCGTGNNLTALEALGSPTGCDLTWSALQYARSAGKTRVARASAARLPFVSAAFDVVTSFDVFQCLSDAEEQAAAAEIYRVLRPGGHALLNVAAMDVLWGSHSVFAHEVRRYDRARLRRVLTGAGFEVLRLTHTNAVLFPIVFAVRLAMRLRGLPASDADAGAGIEMRVPPRLINAVLSGLLRAEAALVRRVDLPFGSSLICLARRPDITRGA